MTVIADHSRTRRNPHAKHTGFRTNLYFVFRRGQRRKIQRCQPRDRADAVDRVGYARHDHRSGHQIHGTLADRPVAICDTAGLDDNTALGEARAEKTYEILRKTDIAVLVVDSTAGLSASDAALIEIFREKKLPYLVCYNKSDLAPVTLGGDNELAVCALTGEGIETLKNRLAAFAVKNERTIVADLFAAGDIVLLVTPIDEAAPKGRLILPEQLVLRELLDIHALPFVVQETELAAALTSLENAAQSRHHRQSGVRLCQKDRAGKRASHVVFHSHAAV